jgi:hypothetical protein
MYLHFSIIIIIFILALRTYVKINEPQNNEYQMNYLNRSYNINITYDRNKKKIASINDPNMSIEITYYNEVILKQNNSIVMKTYEPLNPLFSTPIYYKDNNNKSVYVRKVDGTLFTQIWIFLFQNLMELFFKFAYPLNINNDFINDNFTLNCNNLMVSGLLIKKKINYYNLECYSSYKYNLINPQYVITSFDSSYINDLPKDIYFLITHSIKITIDEMESNIPSKLYCQMELNFLFDSVLSNK